MTLGFLLHSNMDENVTFQCRMEDRRLLDFTEEKDLMDLDLDCKCDLYSFEVTQMLSDIFELSGAGKMIELIRIDDDGTFFKSDSFGIYAERVPGAGWRIASTLGSIIK